MYNLSPTQPPQTFDLNIKCTDSNNTDDETIHKVDQIKSIRFLISTDCLKYITKNHKNIKGKIYDAVPNTSDTTAENARPTIPDL
ncbi:hypothetical protein AGMMS50222_04440 [Endomicrobiia bacterium]|nr:hypothetical protein AGMMS49531_05300 [Endomicrobiia bacterium]GHT65881.1 hypothetical protein AGMMS49556_06270 [Endomicrobiia bacterium]GHT74754.1 hypothetical protein AGMMS50222_04440 [Endomicrobiia bacterium]